MANPQPFKGKVIAITGGASGMGLASAHYLAERGASLSLADVNGKALDAAKESIESKVPDVKILTTVVDVVKSKQVDDWVASTVSKLGSLDGCVNLAGVIGKSLGVAKTTELSNEEWDFVLGVNLTGLFYCLRAQLKAISHGGSIVNAASTGGLVGLGQMAAYSTAKHGVVGLTRSCAKEVGDTEVRVNCVCPGPIDTPMNAEMGRQMGQDLNAPSILGRKGKPVEVAALIGYLLGPESTYTTGAAYIVDGGWLC